MDAVEFLKEKKRMCGYYKSCYQCPLGKENNKYEVYCLKLLEEYSEEAVRIVEQWSNEHPVITNLMKFEEVFGKCNPEVTAPISWWSKEYKEPKGE